jgi:hypothetical protein
VSAGNIAAVAISAAMLGMSALLYGITMRQREQDRLHFLRLHRGLASRVAALELPLKVDGSRPEVAVDLSTGMAIVSRKSEVEPEVPTKVEDSTVEMAVAIDREWQQRRDEIYLEAMAQIHGPRYPRETPGTQGQAHERKASAG